MEFINQIHDFITQRSQKEIYRLLGIAATIIVLMLAGLTYYHFNRMSRLRKEMDVVNRARKETQKLLSRYTAVQKQRQEINAVLEKDRAFKIKEYFNALISDQNINQQNVKQIDVSQPQDLRNGYFEIRLDAAITNLSMKKLTELLYVLEKNQRIYIKELQITKTQQQAIDATVTIATLQPKEQD